MLSRKSKVRRYLSTIAAAALLAGNSLKAQEISGSIDSTTTDKALVIDTKLSLDVNKNINLFARNRTSFDYKTDSKIPFTLLNASYNFKNGLGVVGEVQFPYQMNPEPRLGLQYFKKFGNLGLYAEGTARIGNDPNGEILARLRYSHPITSKLEAIAQVEAITDFDGTGLTFATQRCKAGLAVGKNLEFGVEADVTQVPIRGKLETNHTLGGYFTIKF